MKERWKENSSRLLVFLQNGSSITGYSFARHLNKEELTAVAEQISEGESVQELIAIARELDNRMLRPDCN